MTPVRVSARTGHVRDATCPCGEPLLAMPGEKLFVCTSASCSRTAMSAAQVFLLLNQRKPALRAVG